jgi:hypothetical protein
MDRVWPDLDPAESCLLLLLGPAVSGPKLGVLGAAATALPFERLATASGGVSRIAASSLPKPVHGSVHGAAGGHAEA